MDSKEKKKLGIIIDNDLLMRILRLIAKRKRDQVLS